MTTDSYVNSQITGSIAQTNMSVLGDAPAEAMAILYQQMAHTIGLALQNVIAQQQHSYSIHNAITIAASRQLLSRRPVCRLVNGRIPPPCTASKISLRVIL